MWIWLNQKKFHGLVMIKDIILTPLKIINVPGGDVMHGMTLNLIVPNGEIRFVMFDDRDNNYCKFQEVTLSLINYQRLTIPPLVWVGFQGLSKRVSTLLNIANLRHDPLEVDKKDINEIEFDWSL